MRDQDIIAATKKFDRHTRRLLRDLAQLGLVQQDRTPARERLEAEIGDADASALCRSLATGGSRASTDSLGPSRAA